MTSTSRPYLPLSPAADKLPSYYDCLDSSLPPLPPPLSTTQSTPNSTRRLANIRTALPNQPTAPTMSPLSTPTSPYTTGGSNDSGSGWEVAPLPRRGESLPEWLTSPLTADTAELKQRPAAPLLPPHFLPPARLSRDSVSASLSPWTTGSTSPSSSLSSSHSPLSWPSEAMSPSPIDGLSPLPLSASASSSPSSTSRTSRTFTFPPSTESQPPRRRYQRTPGLSREQRAERRRQSHRELDAVRRHRDAAAINRLSQLTTSAHTDASGQQRVKREHEVDGEMSESGDTKGAKRHRTAVLEESVEQMEQLQSLVDRLAAACSQHCSDIASLRLQLLAAGVQPQRAAQSTVQFPTTMPLLSDSITRRLAGELGVSGLYNSLFASESVGLLLLDCVSGVALEVNERLVKGGLCTREDIIGRQVAPTYDAVIQSEEWDSQPPSHSDHQPPIQTTADSNTSLYSQYGVTKENVLSLYRGQVDQIYVVWRAQLGDGLAYELPLSGFVASRDDAAGGRPRTVLVTMSLSEAKRI